MDDKILVSCIIPTYNRAHLLPDAIESTLNQTYPHWELLIIDDGSTDNTSKIVKDYIKKDKRIKYFQNPKKGGNFARNYGISKAKGRYIAFLDDDDICLPHRFEKQLEAMEKGNSGFIVSGFLVKKRGNDKYQKKYCYELQETAAGFPSRWLIRKDLLERVGLFDSEMPSMQDLELSLRLAKHTTYELHNDIVTIIYVTDKSVSTDKRNSVNGLELLLAKNKNLFHPEELCVWYFRLAKAFYSNDDLKNTAMYLELSKKNDNLNYYKLMRLFLRIGITYPSTKKFMLKIIKIFEKYFFPMPKTVNHQIINT